MIFNRIENNIVFNTIYFLFDNHAEKKIISLIEINYFILMYKVYKTNKNMYYLNLITYIILDFLKIS